MGNDITKNLKFTSEMSQNVIKNKQHLKNKLDLK